MVLRGGGGLCMMESQDMVELERQLSSIFLDRVEVVCKSIL